ncbi:hypothetical protein [Agromyces italicus]|uniref:hypothetical protein n=1 Tax=Agromyces italicus TaxID=279572 RepID=UPI00041D5059|nr:hypothetical protein [Agromyces italicus]
MITIPRWLLLVLGALFSAYHVVLGIYSLGAPDSPWPTVVALVLYSAATVASLWPTRRVRMPDWLAAFDLAVSIVLPLLVTSQLDPDADNGYATWYVAAVGTLMTIAAARRRLIAAWAGVIALALQTVLWAGPLALGSLGVIGSLVWVAIAHMLTSALTNAGRETRRYAQAEREAAAWQAAQDAHLFEGRMRLAQTDRVAAPMLRRIADRDGRLNEAQRAECRLLEATVRDEIRGEDAAHRRRAHGGAPSPPARSDRHTARRGRDRRPRRGRPGSRALQARRGHRDLDRRPADRSHGGRGIGDGGDRRRAR